jgi:coproporphyrinogen III oxidase-like Fe-S oxidoreductase
MPPTTTRHPPSTERLADRLGEGRTGGLAAGGLTEGRADGGAEGLNGGRPTEGRAEAEADGLTDRGAAGPPAPRPGLYLHVPFCSAICPYCDFAVQTGGPRRRAEFVDGLVAEIALWRGDAARWQPFDTVYLGGGTPSALAPAELGRILAAARAGLPVEDGAWIALEANPEDVTAASVRQWRELGVAMLSLGVQSFDAGALRFLGRRHTPEQARQAVELALGAGFPTVSIDLIYGEGGEGIQRRSAASGRDHGGQAGNGRTGSGQAGDGQAGSGSAANGSAGKRRAGSERTEDQGAGSGSAGSGRHQAGAAIERWRRDLEQAVALAPQHLSCYQLTVHEGTPFGFRAARGELRELPEAAQAELFRLTHGFLASQGYAPYEVSSFARAPEHRSRHNQKYWDHTSYLGLGPSAHSFDRSRRWWNERKLHAWEAKVAAGAKPVAGGEELGRRELALEEVMLSLRTAAGLDLAGFRRRHGFDLAARNRPLIADLAARGLLARRGERLAPSLDGMAVADSLARGFEVGGTDP